jgi:nitroreductase
MTLSAIEVNQLKHAPPVEGVLPIVLERWSPRAFADRDVDPADLARIFEAARWAPSPFNEQPWRFLVGLRGTETYEKIAAALMPSNRLWALQAPVLILGATKTRFSHNDNPNASAAHDLGAASGFIALQATALGLQAHQMAGFDREKAREAFGIPRDYALGSVIALGYQADPSRLEELFVAGEVAPRTRKPLSEIVFSAWNEPAKIG